MRSWICGQGWWNRSCSTRSRCSAVRMIDFMATPLGVRESEYTPIVKG